VSEREVFHTRSSKDGALRIRYQYRLRDLYEELNSRFWDGRLPSPQRTLLIGGPVETRGISVRRVPCWSSSPWQSARKGLKSSGSCYAVGIFRPPGEFWPATIRIMSPQAPEEERRVLLHEMIHCGLWFAGFTHERHGPRFVVELERLAAHGETWAVGKAEHYREHPE
jgi:hypothetical protein